LREAYDDVCNMAERVKRCSLSDTGNWTNQNVVFTKSLRDMFPVAKAILLGALARDESRGAHFKPDFSMPGLESSDPGESRREAERWCDKFEENTEKWLKSTIATANTDGDPVLTYEEVDTSLVWSAPT
jgi:succinate dehydrogenase / fumarate reductase flavoprotein subunit